MGSKVVLGGVLVVFIIFFNCFNVVGLLNLVCVSLEFEVCLNDLGMDESDVFSLVWCLKINWWLGEN